MIVEISIAALFILKLVGVIDFSWTLTGTFAAMLVVVEINSVVQRKRMESLIYRLASAVDRKVDNLELDIEQSERDGRDCGNHNQ